MKTVISIIVSVYNEEEAINLFWSELKNVLTSATFENFHFEVLMVNDGSGDRSEQLIDAIAAAEPMVKGIHFSKNFGHEAAMLAGIENATGAAIICMDADLQHPPESLKEMIAAFQDGYQVVTMTCIKREDAGIIKRLSSNLFYKIFNKISGGQFEPNASDFFLISKRIALILKHDFSERTRFLRGIIQTIGFRKINITFVAPKRAAGTSKYSIRRLFFFSLTAIATFSHVPLRLGLGIGLIFGLFSLLIGIYSIIEKFLGEPFSGYTTIITLLSFGFSLIFIVLGIIGEYIGFIFSEAKKRPHYIIDRTSESTMSE
jgi:dolichol-phosphate mannosyltransferase